MKLLNRFIGVILLLCCLFIFTFWLIGSGNHATFFLYQKPHKIFLNSGNFELHIFRLLDGYPGVSEYIISGYTEQAGYLKVHSYTSTISISSSLEMQDIHCLLLNDRSLVAESSGLEYVSGNQPNVETPSKNTIIALKLDGDLLCIEKSYGFLLPDVNGNRWIEDIPIRCYGVACIIYGSINLLLYVKRKEL